MLLSQRNFRVLPITVDPTSGFFPKKRKASHLGHVEFEKPLRIPKQLSGAQVPMGSGKNLHLKENPGL